MKRITQLVLAGMATKFIYNRIKEAQYKFNGRVAIITGGSQGLGLELAHQLAEQGAKVVLCARDERELQEAKQKILFKQQDAQILTIPADVTDENDVKKLVVGTLDEYQKIDMLINNAGTMSVGPDEAMSQEDYEKSLNTHFWGPYRLIEAVLPNMKSRGEGRIINIVSIGGKVSVPHLLPYNTGKYAFMGYSEGMYASLKKFGIYVTTVVPGLMRTGSAPQVDLKGNHEQEYDWFKTLSSNSFLTMDAERAASKILAAARRGDTEVVLSIPARIMSVFHGLFPSLSVQLLGELNRFMPSDNNPDSKKGHEIEEEREKRKQETATATTTTEITDTTYANPTAPVVESTSGEQNNN